MRGTQASFSLSLSIDPDEQTFSEYDIINQLVKIAHIEIAEEIIAAQEQARSTSKPVVKIPKGFNEVVKRVMAYDSLIKEDDIYSAVLSTTPLAKQKVLSEYAKVQAVTRKHVKDIGKVESMITKAASDLLRHEKCLAKPQPLSLGCY